MSCIAVLPKDGCEGVEKYGVFRVLHHLQQLFQHIPFSLIAEDRHRHSQLVNEFLLLLNSVIPAKNFRGLVNFLQYGLEFVFSQLSHLFDDYFVI